MLRIVVGGALNKNENAALIEQYGQNQVEVKVMGDLQAAMALKNGEADYYFGSCQTGAGGALSMAGKVLDDAEIAAAIAEGKTAFGFVPEAAATVIPVIMGELLK